MTVIGPDGKVVAGAYPEMASMYNGTATCCLKECTNPTRWMPVVEIRPRAPLEGVMPMGLLGLGLCDEHKATFGLPDVEDGSDRGILAHARRILAAQGKAEPDPERTTVVFCQVAKEA